MSETRTMKASAEAIEELRRRVQAEPKLYKGRGMTGALDMVLFGEFKTTGVGNNWGGKKKLQKLCKTREKNLQKSQK